VITIRIWITGTIVNVVIVLLFGFINSWEMAMKVTGGVGAISWAIAGILSGAFISGDRMRAIKSKVAL
jgi:hypothetical protein